MASDLEFIRHPALLVVTGSRLYGTARYDAQGNCISDEDFRGVVLPPINYLIGLQNFDEGELEGDHKVWSLKNFLQMLLKGNAQALECLFAPPSFQKVMTPLGAEILKRRHLFLGKHYYKAISGYAYSEWRKVRGVKIVIPDRTKTEDDVIQGFLNVFNHLPKDTKDEVIALMYSQHEKKEVSSLADVGSKRRLEYEKYGYSVTGAHHSLRMLYQCEEVLSTGNMTFPRPEASLLSSVKRGNMPFSDIEAIYNDLSDRTAKLYKTSILPDRPDSKAVWNFYENVVRDELRRNLM